MHAVCWFEARTAEPEEAEKFANILSFKKQI